MLQNKKILRDYTIKIDHPHNKNYNNDKANKNYSIWFEKQPLVMQEKMLELMDKHTIYLIG